MNKFTPVNENLTIIVLSLRPPSLTNQVLFHFELCSATWSNRFPRLSWASPPSISHDMHRHGQWLNPGRCMAPSFVSMIHGSESETKARWNICICRYFRLRGRKYQRGEHMTWKACWWINRLIYTRDKIPLKRISGYDLKTWKIYRKDWGSDTGYISISIYISNITTVTPSLKYKYPAAQFE